jgi:undecaprenyl diphosphate synthase
VGEPGVPAGPVGTLPTTLEAIVPRHVAIIMDGNRRWARERGLPDAHGHAAGVEAIRPIVEASVEAGVEVLSLYAFSRENWARGGEEVAILMGLLESAIRDETPRLAAQGVRVRLLGRMDELAPATRAAIDDALSATADGRRMLLNVAFNYSSRSEIADALRACVADGLAPEAVSEEAIAARLYTAGMPDPDLLIRTGGDQRVSNFLLWQAAYAELYFCERYWPDFGREAFAAALADYANRSRRFGR